MWNPVIVAMKIATDSAECNRTHKELAFVDLHTELRLGVNGGESSPELLANHNRTPLNTVQRSTGARALRQYI